MVTPQQVSAKVHEATQAAEHAIDSENPLLFRKFDEMIRQLEALAREGYQAKLKDDYKPILEKLENGDPLNGTERDRLKLLIVGEAKYYLKTENDLENWRAELQRLADEMEQLESAGLDNIDDLLHMYALCRDARNILPDITFYYREKARIERFEEATSGQIDAESGKILADVIRGMMTSPKM